MKMADRLRRFENLAPVELESSKAALIRRWQERAPRHPRPINLMPGTADPECEACEGDATVCTLQGPSWRLCPHAGPTPSSAVLRPWPEAR